MLCFWLVLLFCKQEVIFLTMVLHCRYSSHMFDLFTEIFNWLPLAHCINEKVLVSIFPAFTYVCRYIRMYIRTYIRMYVYNYVHMYLYMHVHNISYCIESFNWKTHECFDVRIYICALHMYIRTCICVKVWPHFNSMG